MKKVEAMTDTTLSTETWSSIQEDSLFEDVLSECACAEIALDQTEEGTPEQNLAGAARRHRLMEGCLMEVCAIKPMV